MCAESRAPIPPTPSHPSRLDRLPQLTFSKKKNSMKAFDAKRAKLAAMDEKKREDEVKKHADEHCAQCFDCAPLVPFHYVVFDPMHAVHNEINVILDEVCG